MIKVVRILLINKSKIIDVDKSINEIIERHMISISQNKYISLNFFFVFHFFEKLIHNNIDCYINVKITSHVKSFKFNDCA